MLEKMGQIKPRDLWQVMNWSKCFHICKNCLFPPACQVICAACVPSAGEIHFRRLYCLFLKMRNMYQTLAMSHSSPAPAVQEYLLQRQIDMALYCLWLTPLSEAVIVDVNAPLPRDR